MHQILIFISGVIICLVISLIIFIPKLKTKRIDDTENLKKHQDLLKRIDDLTDVANEASAAATEFEQALAKLEQDLIFKNQEFNNITDNVNNLLTQRDEIAKSNELLIEVSNKRYEEHIEKLSQQNFEREEEYQEEYLKTLKDLTEEFNLNFESIKLEKIELENQLDEARAVAEAAIQANIRQKQIDEKADFYKLQLSEEDLQEIKRLKEVANYLRDKEPLNKIIWKVYYEKPTTDLIGRVVGAGRKTGIYKITNLNDGMCYVGQAVDIAARWKQHIKRGLGAETPTRNKLYPIMSSVGVENFSFEIIEECDASKLNRQEDYWQDYFQATTFGYSIK